MSDIKKTFKLQVTAPYLVWMVDNVEVKAVSEQEAIDLVKSGVFGTRHDKRRKDMEVALTTPLTSVQLYGVFNGKPTENELDFINGKYHTRYITKPGDLTVPSLPLFGQSKAVQPGEVLPKTRNISLQDLSVKSLRMLLRLLEKSGKKTVYGQIYQKALHLVVNKERKTAEVAASPQNRRVHRPFSDLVRSEGMISQIVEPEPTELLEAADFNLPTLSFRSADGASNLTTEPDSRIITEALPPTPPLNQHLGYTYNIIPSEGDLLAIFEENVILRNWTSIEIEELRGHFYYPVQLIPSSVLYRIAGPGFREQLSVQRTLMNHLGGPSFEEIYPTYAQTGLTVVLNNDRLLQLYNGSLVALNLVLIDQLATTIYFLNDIVRKLDRLILEIGRRNLWGTVPAALYEIHVVASNRYIIIRTEQAVRIHDTHGRCLTTDFFGHIDFVGALSGADRTIMKQILAGNLGRLFLSRAQNETITAALAS